MRRFYSLFVSRDFLNKSWLCMTATKPDAKRIGPKEIQIETRRHDRVRQGSGVILKSMRTIECLSG